MKRSVLAVVLVLSMLFTLAACGDDKNPGAYELINSAIKKTEALDSADMKIVMNMSIDMDGFSMDVPVEYDVKAVDMQSESPKMNMVMKMGMLGMSVNVDCYVEDGYYYMYTMGQKMKVKAEAGDEYDALGQADELMVDLDAEYLKDVAIVSGADGKKTVKLEMDNDAFQEVFDELIGSTGDGAATGGNVTSIRIPEAHLEITVDKNGYIDTYKVAFEMEMTIESQGASYDAAVELDASIQYNNPGTPVTVIAPDGYKDYPEVNPDTLG